MNKSLEEYKIEKIKAEIQDLKKPYYKKNWIPIIIALGSVFGLIQQYLNNRLSEKHSEIKILHQDYEIKKNNVIVESLKKDIRDLKSKVKLFSDSINLLGPNLQTLKEEIAHIYSRNEFAKEHFNILYKVKENEDLVAIGFNHNVNPTFLKKYNNLKTMNVAVGQYIFIPDMNRRVFIKPNRDLLQWKTYIVKKGDNIWQIARENNITVKVLKLSNNIKGSLINVGQKLLMPNVTKEIKLNQ